MPKAESLKENLTAAGTPAESGSGAPPERSGKEPVKMRATAPRGLNLRSGPGRDFPVVAVLPAGTEVTVWETWADGSGAQGWFEFHVPGWACVFDGMKAGWVDRSYLAGLPLEEPV